MDHGLLKFLLRANLVAGVLFLVLTLLFTFAGVSEPSTVATGFNWRAEACLLRSAFDSGRGGFGLRSCWDLLNEAAGPQARLVATELLILAQFCGLAAAALLLNAFTLRRTLGKK